MKIPSCTLILTLMACVGCGTAKTNPTIRSDVPTAETMYKAAQAEAKAAKKIVLVVFASQNASWSNLLDEFHEDPEVAEVLSRHSVLVRIDVLTTPGGENMYFEFGGERGLPAFSLADDKGKVLADSCDSGPNLGFPNNDDEVNAYFVALKKARPQVTDEEFSLLRTKLEHMRLEITPESPAIR